MDVEQILKEATTGDPEAARRLREFLSSEDTDALERVIEKLRRLEALEERQGTKFWADLKSCMEATDSNPASTGEELRVLEEQARRLGSCETVQVLGVRSFRHRLLGEMGVAQDLLAEAWVLALRCRAGGELNPCILDLHRRQGVLEAALGRPEVGLHQAQVALDGYRLLGDPGHDLDSAGEAKSLYARAEIRFALRDCAGAAADFSTCLDLFRVESKVWSLAQHNLAAVLAETDRAGRERAYELLHHPRLTMRHVGDCVEHATFLWVDGQLTKYLGRQRAMKKLRAALDGFAVLRMPPHYIGVAHDIARALFPRRDKIKAFLDEIRPTALGLISDRRHGELFNEVYGLVNRCPSPTTLTRLDTTLRRLRDLVSFEASLPPCFLTSL